MFGYEFNYIHAFTVIGTAVFHENLRVPIQRDHAVETALTPNRQFGKHGGEQVRVTTLREFDPATVDMLTVVLVGSSETRAVARAGGAAWVYTPRGYGGTAKAEQAS